MRKYLALAVIMLIAGTQAISRRQMENLGRGVIAVRTADNQNLRIYTTTIPTGHRIRTLMHDPQYRLAIATQNVAYNQPPNTSFFLGTGMKKAPKPDIEVVKIK